MIAASPLYFIGAILLLIALMHAMSMFINLWQEKWQEAGSCFGYMFFEALLASGLLYVAGRMVS